MRKTRTMLAGCIAVCLAITIFGSERGRGQEQRTAAGTSNSVTQATSGKAQPKTSGEYKDECYYDSYGDYVCDTVFVPTKEGAQPARSNMAGAAKPNIPLNAPPILGDLDGNSQEQKKAMDLKTVDADSLIRTRNALRNSIENMKVQLTALNEIRLYLLQLPTAQNAERAEIKAAIAQDEGTAGLGRGQGENPDYVANFVRQKEKDLRLRMEELDIIDSEITHRLTVEAKAQTFKFYMSLLFACIVAVLIISFFVVAYRYPEISSGIFTGRTGLQFITLFSLVIAIILFGITGVLEGKELAALLAGIAGYILGAGVATPSRKGEPTPKVEKPIEQGKKQQEEIAERQAA